MAFTPTGRLTEIHFASAMTLTGHIDGASASYLEIAEVLTSQGAEAGKDLLELWTRIVFNIMASNTDDHLRNHGFFAHSEWVKTLSGLRYESEFLGLALDIDENDNALDLDLARSVAPYFRIRDNEALRTITRLREIFAGWREIAAQVGITGGEQDSMALAFQAARRRRPYVDRITLEWNAKLNPMFTAYLHQTASVRIRSRIPSRLRWRSFQQASERPNLRAESSPAETRSL